MEKKIGLMGGTFDPIHIVHLFIGAVAMEELALESVIFMPAGSPPHKEPHSITPARHRLAMAELAVKNEPGLETSDFELTRNAPSYTIDTVRHLRSTMAPGTSLYLLMGSDSLLELGTWKDHDELLSLARPAVFLRPGHPLEDARLPGGYDLLSAGGVTLDLCSSAIRERVKSGRSIRHLVPGVVEEYIMSHGLYRAGRS